VLIVDIKEATKKAQLTDQQKKVYYYRFLMEYTLAETAEVMQITIQGVDKHVTGVVAKICKILNGEQLRKVAA